MKLEKYILLMLISHAEEPAFKKLLLYSRRLILSDTKIAIILLDTLEVWKKLNVTAFLMSGIIGKHPELIGDQYVDNSERQYLALNRQPTVILQANSILLEKIHGKIQSRGINVSIYIHDMFNTGNDSENRKVVSTYNTEDLPIVGIGIREERKTVDKITKGAQLHP